MLWLESFPLSLHLSPSSALRVIGIKTPSTNNRAQLSILIQGSWTIGAFIANLANIPLVAYLPVNLGWRVGLSIGAVVGIFTLLARIRLLPESPRWLLSKGRLEEAEAVCRHIETASGQSDNNVGIDPVVYENRGESSGFFVQVAILCSKFPTSVIFAAIIDLTQSFGIYGLNNLLALTILPAIVGSDADVPIVFTVGSLGSIPGILLAAMLINRVGQKTLLPLSFALCALSCAAVLPVYENRDETWIFVVGE